MRWFVLILILAACDTPGLEFHGVPAEQVEVRGMTFAVRIMGNRAEAIRINRMARPKMDQVGYAAALAIERVSGCKVRQLDGDVAVVTATLRCRDGP